MALHEISNSAVTSIQRGVYNYLGSLQQKEILTYVFKIC